MNKILIKNSQLIFWFGFILSIIVLFFPSNNTGGVEYIDKVAHFMIFSLLGLFAFVGFGNKIIIFILLLLYMVLVEIIQELYIPGRSYDFYDLLAGFGGLLFVTIWIKTIKNDII